MRQRPAASAAYTLTELCTTLVLVSLLFGALAPAVARPASAASDRKDCLGNLREIGQALLLYANENKGNFPRTVYGNTGTVAPTAYT